jgi:murein DD-endopeptidase MepM/ murein hydrolase activator NlpD
MKTNKIGLLSSVLLPLVLTGCLRETGAPVDYRGNIIYGREASYDEKGNEIPKYSKENPATLDTKIADKYIAKEAEYGIAAEVPEVKSSEGGKGLTHLESHVDSLTHAPQQVSLADTQAEEPASTGNFFTRLSAKAKQFFSKINTEVAAEPALGTQLQTHAQAQQPQVEPALQQTTASKTVETETHAHEAQPQPVVLDERKEADPMQAISVSKGSVKLASETSEEEKSKAKAMVKAMEKQKKLAEQAKFKEEKEVATAQQQHPVATVTEMSETEKVVKAAALDASKPVKKMKIKVRPVNEEVDVDLPVKVDAELEPAVPLPAEQPAAIAALPAPKPVMFEGEHRVNAAEPTAETVAQAQTQAQQVASLAPAAAPTPVAVSAPVATQQTTEQAPSVAENVSSHVAFAWPVKGQVVSKFGNVTAQGRTNEGVNIVAAEGAPVTAAADGVVVYADNRLKGYGNMIIVQHANGWLSAYAHAGQMNVHKGERVTAGQPIATVGATGDVERPQLHFALRKDKQPVDPQKFVGKGA